MGYESGRSVELAQGRVRWRTSVLDVLTFGFCYHRVNGSSSSGGSGGTSTVVTAKVWRFVRLNCRNKKLCQWFLSKRIATIQNM
jgi:hypothetical protein